MVYLIHLERSRTEVKHCIAILEGDANETLNIYYIQPNSQLMANLLALGVEWTVIRLWEERPWYKQWPWHWRKAERICPICGVKC
jgi:hypothetical protein